MEFVPNQHSPNNPLGVGLALAPNKKEKENTMSKKINKALITAATVAAVSTLGAPLAHASQREVLRGVSGGQNDCKAGAPEPAALAAQQWIIG